MDRAPQAQGQAASEMNHADPLLAFRARDELRTLAEVSAGVGVWDLDLTTEMLRGTAQTVTDEIISADVQPSTD